jgi:argininosuccinate lyase
VFDALRFEAAVARRNTPGGTGPAAVARQMADLEAWLDAQPERARVS